MNDRNAFLHWSLSEFPELADDFDGESATMRLNWAFYRLRDAIQGAIDANAPVLLDRYFDVCERLLYDGNLKLIELLRSTVLEHLQFHDQRKRRSWALVRMPARTATAFATTLGCTDAARSVLKTGG